MQECVLEDATMMTVLADDYQCGDEDDDGNDHDDDDDQNNDYVSYS